jgi:uncharacterized protein (TIGR02271 family)
MNAFDMQSLTSLEGSPVYDTTGDKIGKVEEIFYDEHTNKPEWIGIGTGFLSTKRVLVPVVGANAQGDGVTVPYSKDQVKGAPDVDGDEVSEQTERELYTYYGIDYSEQRSESVLPAGQSAPATDTQTTGVEYRDTRGTQDRESGQPNVEEYAVTRSEEELAVGTRQVETGRVRLRKWVTTEPVEAQVRVRQETAHVERQPLNEVVTGAVIGEETIDVELHGEEAVAGKRVVAKERITLDKDVETVTETVRDQVRKEHVEVEGDTQQGRLGR